MSGFSLPLRTAACSLVMVVGTAFVALGCSGRSGDDDASSHADEENDDGVDDGFDDDDGVDDDNDGDDDGLTSDPDGTADDDDGPMTTDPDGDDDADDDDSTVSADDGGDGGQDPLEDMGDVEMVAGGFAFAEGPVWVPELGAVLFTDIPADAIVAYDPSTNAAEPFIQGTGAYVNGLDLDALGNLLMCEGGNQRLTRRAANDLGGSIDVVADMWAGDPFNSPNDVATHESGSVFFTDPTYGTSAEFGGSPPVLGFQGIYRIDHDGELSLVDDTLEQPNGVVISPSGDTMYVADTVTTEVFAYPLDEAGQPGDRSLLFNATGGGDGMTIDADGNLYVASADGIEVWRPDGSSRWGTIGMPDVPTNCAFGGEDLRDLYVTLATQLVRVRLAVPGLENAS
jgi:gluconolactonase